MPDYIPQKDSELVAWSANFTGQVVANAAAWGIPPGEVSVLQEADTAFAVLHAQADSPAKNSNHLQNPVFSRGDRPQV
jgi:hypothetical protein